MAIVYYNKVLDSLSFTVFLSLILLSSLQSLMCGSGLYMYPKVLGSMTLYFDWL